MTGGAPMIVVDDMRKAFGLNVALQGVDLTVQRGTIQALLGRNGAGKSTLVRILSTLLEPDGGSAQIGGADVVRDRGRVRSLIGLAGQAAAVDPTLTGRENLELVGRLYGLPRHEARVRSHEVLERLSLTAAADRRVLTYSGGMRRRLDVGASLVGRPLVLLMDEPTTGLDPGTRRDLWRLVEDLAKDGTTILLTTQYLEEADHLADQIAVLEQGRIVAAGSPTELKDRLGQDVLEVRTGNSVDAERVRRILVGLGSGQPVADSRWQKVTLTTAEPMATLLAAGSRIETSGIVVEDLGLRRPTLDEVFLTVTAATDAGEPNGSANAAHAGGSAANGGALTVPGSRPPEPPLNRVRWRRRWYLSAAAIAALAAIVLIFTVLSRKEGSPTQAAGSPRAALAPTSSGAVHTASAHTGPAAVSPVPLTSISSISRGRSTISLDAAPADLSADTSGNIWAALPQSGAVVRIDPATGRTQTFRVGGQPTTIAAAFDRIWVGGSALGPLAALNIVTGQPLGQAGLTRPPAAMALYPDDESLCTLDSSGTLTHLTSTGLVAGAANLAHAAAGVACGEGWGWAVQSSPAELIRTSDRGVAGRFNGGPAPVAVALDRGVWIANRNGVLNVFNPLLNVLRVNRSVRVAPELDGVYAVENDSSVWAFSRQTHTVYRISNTPQPSLTATAVFNSPPVALVRVGQSIWVGTQDGKLTQIHY